MRNIDAIRGFIEMDVVVFQELSKLIRDGIPPPGWDDVMRCEAFGRTNTEYGAHVLFQFCGHLTRGGRWICQGQNLFKS